MADPRSGFLGEGNYSTRANEARALKRAEDKGPIEVIPGEDVLKPEPCADWVQGAKELWFFATNDEATKYWGSGDYLRLKMLCSYYHDMLTGKTRYSAQAMEIVMSGLTELRLSDRAKRSDGIIVSRDPMPIDPTEAWLSEVLRAELENH